MKIVKEIHICVGYNKPDGMTGMLHSAHFKSHYKCDNKASVFEDGKWWCKKHAPSKIKEREEKSWNNYIKRIKRNDN